MRSRYCLCLLAIATTAQAADTGRTLFDFDGNSSRRWQTVNDGVMGGRSVGRYKINNDQTMEFYGTLSLANNGGFASVRSRGRSLGLKAGDAIVLRVRGDGRKYSFNLYTPTRRMAFSYRAEFQTKQDTWVEVTLPLDRFGATSFGRRVRSTLKPGDVSGVGIVLGDKKPGPFKLQVDWIKVQPATSQAAASSADRASLADVNAR